MIFEYVKDKNGQRRGVVCAVEKNGVGWSFCNVKAGDRFDKKMAITIATGRAMKNCFKWKSNVPYEVKPFLKKMTERAKRYFK